MSDWSADTTQRQQPVGSALRLTSGSKPDEEHFTGREYVEWLDEGDAEDKNDGRLR